MIRGHETEEKISIKKFLEIIKRYDEKKIETTVHTFVRINQKQRGIFNDKTLREYILGERPIEVIRQTNGNLSVIYKYKESERNIKIVLNIRDNKIYIVTFYLLNKEQEGNVGK